MGRAAQWWGSMSISELEEPGSNSIDSISLALWPTHYEASGNLYVKLNMYSHYHIGDTLSSSVT